MYFGQVTFPILVKNGSQIHWRLLKFTRRTDCARTRTEVWQDLRREICRLHEMTSMCFEFPDVFLFCIWRGSILRHRYVGLQFYCLIAGNSERLPDHFAGSGHKFCLLSPLQDGALIHYKQTTFLLEHQCEITLETLTSVCSSLECDFGTSALPFNPYRCFEAECWAKLAGYRSFKAISEDLHRLRSAPRSRRYSCTRGDGGNGS